MSTASPNRFPGVQPDYLIAQRKNGQRSAESPLSTPKNFSVFFSIWCVLIVDPVANQCVYLGIAVTHTANLEKKMNSHKAEIMNEIKNLNGRKGIEARMNSEKKHNGSHLDLAIPANNVKNA